MHKLYIKQKVFAITDHYQVYDEDQNPIFQVDQEFLFWGARYDVKRLDGMSSFKLEKKKFSFMPEFYVTFQDSKVMRIVQNFSWFKKDIDIISDDYNLKLVGSLWDLDFQVFNGEDLVGEIHKEFMTWADTYEITVHDPIFEDDLLALFIALDNIKDAEEAN